MKFNVHIRYRPEIADYEVIVIGEQPYGRGPSRTFRLTPADAITNHGAVPNKPFVDVDPETYNGVDHRSFIQAFVDEAYRAGLRPSSEVADSQAQTKHLEDMRAIAFKQLQMEGPKR